MTSRNALSDEPKPAESPVYYEERLNDEPGRRERRQRTMLIVAAGGLIVLLIGSWFAFRDRSKKAAAAAESANAAAPAPAAVPVSTVTATSRELPLFIEANGSLVAYESTDVASMVAGKVVATPVDAGSFVRKGQVIARLDDRDARLHVQQAQAAVAQAQANVTQARSNLGLSGGQPLDPSQVAEVESARAQMVLAETNERRYRSLLETGDIPQAQYDEIKARAETARKTYEATLAKAKAGGAGIDVASSGVEAARANLDLAKKALADTVIAAPLSGYVSDRPTAVGEWLTNQSKVATIVQVDTLKLMLNVAEADAARVRTGMSVKLKVDAFTDREFGGNVAAIIPSLDPSSRSLVVQVDVPNPGGALKPGMFATAQMLEPAEGRTGVMVPKEAVVATGSGSAIVYVIRDDKAEARVVQLGQEVEGWVQVVNGVSSGDEVATAGADRLSDGAPIIKQAR